tara:strand:+ start:559 stop:819 length:261 start_codon:yes stop_codon:yes gene_type:complete
MRISESKLRSIIRRILVEGRRVRASIGDRVRVLHVDPPYGYDRMDWGGCVGYISSIRDGFCTIMDPTGELGPLHNIPLDSSYIRII